MGLTAAARKRQPHPGPRAWRRRPALQKMDIGFTLSRGGILMVGWWVCEILGPTGVRLLLYHSVWLFSPQAAILSLGILLDRLQNPVRRSLLGTHRAMRALREVLAL